MQGFGGSPSAHDFGAWHAKGQRVKCEDIAGRVACSKVNMPVLISDLCVCVCAKTFICT